MYKAKKTIVLISILFSTSQVFAAVGVVSKTCRSLYEDFVQKQREVKEFHDNTLFLLGEKFKTSCVSTP